MRVFQEIKGELRVEGDDLNLRITVGNRLVADVKVLLHDTDRGGQTRELCDAAGRALAQFLWSELGRAQGAALAGVGYVVD